MITIEEVRTILVDIESDRAERTISTTNTDKFGQAICAFANDLPDHRKPGYLLLGVENDGTVKGLEVTDDLLKNVASIHTSGNLQPQPSVVVEKMVLEEGDIVVVKVEPSLFPPVRYKGRIWIRIGSRKGIASEADERILLEKRRANITSFDASPCIGATIDDLDLFQFKHVFLPKAMTEEEIGEDGRDVRFQLCSYGFYDVLYDCPTYAGLLFFAKNLRRFVPGAYIQYVRFAGQSRAGEILTEHEFSDNLMKTLPELDVFVKTTIVNRRPIPVSALREDVFFDYPEWSTRELLMNAICHRDYSSHGPIQFYQYDDRIEIMNHGGLYGRANESNFPYVNDYRNLVVAEAMKVLGYVNRHSRGVLRVQDELATNGNGKALFDFGYQTALLVVEPKSCRGEQAARKAVSEGLILPDEADNWSEKGSEKRSGMTIFDDGKPSQGSSANKVSPFPSPIVEEVYKALNSNRKAKYYWLMDNLGVSESTIKRAISDLKKLGFIDAERSKINGEWQLIVPSDKVDEKVESIEYQQFIEKLYQRINSFGKVNSVEYEMVIEELSQVLSQACPKLSQAQCPKLAEVIIALLDRTPKPISELMRALGESNRSRFRNNILNKLVEFGIVVPIYPDNPRHPQQKYVLTVFGVDVVSKMEANLNGNISLSGIVVLSKKNKN